MKIIKNIGLYALFLIMANGFSQTSVIDLLKKDIFERHAYTADQINDIGQFLKYKIQQYEGRKDASRAITELSKKSSRLEQVFNQLHSAAWENHFGNIHSDKHLEEEYTNLYKEYYEKILKPYYNEKA